MRTLAHVSQNGHKTSHIPRIAGKLLVAVAGTPRWLAQMAMHPVGASLCLALVYIILCALFLSASGRMAANASWSVEQLRKVELLKGLTFIVITGAAYFGFAYRLLRRISTQQYHLALLFQSVSDSLFLLRVEDDGAYRVVCVNNSFLKLTGLKREAVIDERVEAVLPEGSQEFAKEKYREAVSECKMVSWEQTERYPAGERVGEITVTPLANGAGKINQIAVAIRDITERKIAQRRDEACNRRLHILSRRLVEAQESERRHIARELHDGIGQALTAAQMNLQAVLRGPCPEPAALRVRECLKEVEEVLEQVHDLSLELRPSMLDDLGLKPALRWYTNRQAGLAGLEARFVTDPDERRFDPVVETECFRIAQEALNNVVRHAKAHKVTVELREKKGQLHLDVKDDGVGFDVAPTRDQAVRGRSLGLLSMEERATLAGGRLEFKSSPGKGTDVHAWFPVENKITSLNKEEHQDDDERAAA